MPLKLLSEEINEYSDTVLHLDEVSISAVKSGIDMNSAALSSTLIGNAQINNLDITDIKQISGLVPNLYIPDYGSRITSSIYVRGLGSRIDQPVIGLTFDNIPIMHKNNFDFDITGLEKVEFLRGAQSTLYGRNAMAGVMNIYTLSPLHFNGWKLGAQYGSFNSFKFTAGWYHLMNPYFGIGLSADYLQNGGYWINKYNSSRTGKQKQGSARLKLAWHPENGLKIDNTTSISVVRQGGYSYQWVETGEINYNDTCFYNRTGILEGFTIAFPLTETVNMNSVTSLQYLDDNMTLDQDFLPEDYFTLSQITKELALTEEFSFNGTALLKKYKWLAGLFLWSKDGRMHAPVLFKDYGIKKLIEENRNNANPYYPIKWNDDSFLIDTHFKPRSRGVSLFHESNYSTKHFDFTAALRFDCENTSLNYTSSINTSYTVYDTANNTVYRIGQVDIHDKGKLSDNYIQFLPKISVLYRWNDIYTDNIYLSIAKGYKSGGFNTQMFSDVMQQRLQQEFGISMPYKVEEIVSFLPETSWNYELGFHCSLPGSNGNLSGDVFFIDCRNQQLTTFPAGVTTGRIMTNAGRTRSIGGELSANWNIDSKWTVMATWGVADARFIDYDDGKGDYKGKHVPYAPLNTLYLQADYTLSFEKGKSIIDKFGVTASMSAAGPIWWNEENSLKQNFYATPDVYMRASKGILEFEAWIKNITSTRYSTFYFKSMNHEFLQKALPLTWGVSVKFTI